MKPLSSADFLKYYLQYYEKIYRYLYFRAYEDEELARDLASETFLKAYEKCDTYDPQKKFSAWIYTVARNCLIDHFRKNPRNRETSLEEYKEDTHTGYEKMSEKVDTLLKRKQLLFYTHELPEKFREIVLLKYFNEYENKEITDMLNLNPNTLRVLHHRAMKMLQGIIPPHLRPNLP